MFSKSLIAFVALCAVLVESDARPLDYRLPKRASSAAGNFGSCSVPQIEFGVGFDNRKETSFQPVDKKSFNHGSAQGVGIITKFMCDTLTNSCKADATAKATCAKAIAAADGQTPKTGAQADAFNAAFGIQTQFAKVAAVSDQGKVVAAAATKGKRASSAAGNFGSCSVPQIEFGVGFDNRKETSFQPVDKKSFNHGSAQGVGIITKFMCDTLTNSCKADATAKATCAKAIAAADGQPPKTGAQADAFNAAFGIQTQFAKVAAISDQGKVVAAAAPKKGKRASSAAGDFGSCSVPQIEFGVGFDNRKETSFQPVDKTSYNHGSAQGIAIITRFMCDQLVNSCKADATAKASCAKAITAADGQTAKTGAQADAFNAVFGIQTQFSQVAVVSDQGKTVVPGAAAATPAATNNAQATDAAGCASAVTVTVTSAAAANTNAADTCPTAVTATVTAVVTAGAADAAATSSAVSVAPAATTASASAPAASGAASAIGDVGSCSVPQITFAQGLDGRKETSFVPTDLKSFNHGSADAVGLIANFICGQLGGKCGGDATAQATCKKATADAAAATVGTGAQADAFNAAFGVVTDFATTVPQVSNQGSTIGAVAAAKPTATDASATASSVAAGAAATTAAGASSAVGNFGSCSIPQIEFGVGFEGRKETSFQPVDKKSFNHGSAQNINIITQFICDTLTNSCKADAAAKATCAKGQAAASAATAKQGIQADAFNAAFGITTQFAKIAAVSDTGVTQAAGAAGAAATAA